MNDYEQDEIKIKEAYKQNGYNITNEQAGDIWSEHSESVLASWLDIPSDCDLNNLFESTKDLAKELKIIF